MKKMVIIFLGFFSFNLFAYQLSIHVKKIKSIEGDVAIAIHNEERTYLKDGEKPFKAIVRKITSDEEIFQVDLAEGSYAITLFHDLNGNQKLDTNFLGIPKEPFGFSNNKKIVFGPPSYEESLFDIDSDKEIDVFLKTIF
ncbi:MAG: DUF2141 domain-containing protein [Halobacteriovoraceae bacterium]|nr:DUF2141 domain-containing protein [Halobacteriovoraceae bacterium]MCB9095285.1 DUF2141 domain-containing protein [Halobacteriovoraceae bacterium]